MHAAAARLLALCKELPKGAIGAAEEAAVWDMLELEQARLVPAPAQAR